jgi:hypothetical protein
MRAEIRERKKAEAELQKLHQEMKTYKENTEKWKLETLDNYENAIKKMKSQVR